MEASDVFDTEAFICEIQKLPCLWNYKSESFFSAQTLQERWKTLRDGLNRYFKTINKQKSGSAAFQTRQYVYFHQLSFLTPLAEEKAITVGSLDTVSPDGTQEIHVTPTRNELPGKRKQRLGT
jgi:hypothetical protein